MVRSLVVAGSLLVVVFAGCAGSDPGTSSSDIATFDDLGGHATETTGLIRGVVVDTAVVPIPSASVSISGPSKSNLTADTQGRFLIDGLAPGTYFVKAKAPLYHESSTSVEVVAGVNEPPVTKVQLAPFFSQKPYHLSDKKNGYFDCSQNGASPFYSSSNCLADPCPTRVDPATCNQLPTAMMNNITNQNREWHMDVGPGWQSIVLEMQWTPTAQGTSPRMGMVVSTYKPLRNPAHSFANVQMSSPLLIRLDTNVTHPTAGTTVEPFKIPVEGMDRVSYFVSARADANAPCIIAVCVPPGIALQQSFTVIWHQFYYGIVKPDWSFLKGDKPPF